MQKSFLSKVLVSMGAMGGGFFQNYTNSNAQSTANPHSSIVRQSSKKFVSKAKRKRIRKIAKISRRKNRGAYRG